MMFAYAFDDNQAIDTIPTSVLIVCLAGLFESLAEPFIAHIIMTG
jgi:hypothetical protein